MRTPSPELRYRAVAMRLAPLADERHADLLLTLEDGTTLTVECENDAIQALQRPASPPASPGTRESPDQGTRGDAIAGEAADAGSSAAAFPGDRRHHNQATASDVTERIEAQRENVESRRIFADLFDNSDAAIIDHDFSMLFRAVQELKRDGVRSLRGYLADSEDRLNKLVNVVHINNANAAALRMLGASSVGNLGIQTTNIVDVAEAMFQGEARIRGSEYLVAGGTPIPVVYSLRIPRTEEEARRVLIVIMDLSDIRLAEAARQATVAKSQFLSSMSHEIRTPLNGVIGNLELLALTALDSEQIDLIDDADKAAKALLGLVGNILDFSKIEAGKLITEVGDINPVALVGEAVDVLQSLGRQKRIFVAATFGADVPSLVRGDAIRIRQILLNLIGNAVKFTELGGVQVSLTVTGWNEEVCDLRFEVSDSGRGFDQVLAPRLFEPFTQDRKAVDGAEGTGLGLSICKSLVEAFGGTIGCEGVSGEGATFWFVLPTPVVRRAPPVTRPDLSGLRVMMVDEGQSAAKPLEDYFIARGAIVVREAPQTALGRALEPAADKATAIDVAVLLPNGGESAAELPRRLREHHIVPLLYGVDQTPNIWLRQGFAAAIHSDTSADHLDRNIRLLVGHAQARDLLAVQQAAVVSAFGESIRGARVLVLEDRLVNQTVIQKQLKKLGIDCVLVGNGIRGLEMLARQSFDLILCDCSMPEMNGYDFTRALRKREMSEAGGRRAPVIALTANAFREDADKCFEAGMDDFISKPVTMDRLAAVLVRWLNSVASAPGVAIVRQAGAEAEAATIDIGVLATILGTDEPDTLNQVLKDFLAAVGISLLDVRAAVTSRDAGRIKAAAHGAKGEARCAAATQLSDLYAELDRRAGDGDQSIEESLVDRAAVEVRGVQDFIRGRLQIRVS